MKAVFEFSMMCFNLSFWVWLLMLIYRADGVYIEKEKAMIFDLSTARKFKSKKGRQVPSNG